MLTSVDQVRENTGVVLVLVSTNAVVKRAARPSVEATVRNSDTARSQDTAVVKKDTAAKNPTTGTKVEDMAISSLTTILTLLALVDTVVKKSRATAVKSMLAILTVRAMASRATLVRSLLVTVLTLIAPADTVVKKATSTVVNDLNGAMALPVSLEASVRRKNTARGDRSMAPVAMVVPADTVMRGTKGVTKYDALCLWWGRRMRVGYTWSTLLTLPWYLHGRLTHCA